MTALAGVTELVMAMTPVDVAPDDPELDAMIRVTRARYHLGARDRMTERATKWYGMSYEGRLVAAVGELRAHYTLEVTDCYVDGSRAGTAAVYALLLGYYKQLERGEFENLVHTCLFENVEMWQAVVRVTGDNPYALMFLHQRKT